MNMLRDVVAILVMVLLFADIARMLIAGPSHPQSDPVLQSAPELDGPELY